jgi:hypothetical protein
MPIVPELKLPQVIRGIADKVIDRAISAVRDAVVAVIDDVEMLKATPDWIEVPAFSGGWSNYNNGIETAAYWRDPWGRVHVRGAVAGGVITSPAFTLPVGYRPPGQVFKAVPCAGADPNGVLFINTNGEVTPFQGVNTYFLLHVDFWTV